MKKRVSISHPGLEYEDFLFAPLGDDCNGTPLAVASILGRMGLDPWSEAAALAALPADVAARKLASVIDATPNQPLQGQGSATLAARLVALLPAEPGQAARQPRRLPDTGSQTVRWPASYVLWLAVFCLLLMGAALA